MELSLLTPLPPSACTSRANSISQTGDTLSLKQIEERVELEGAVETTKDWRFAAVLLGIMFSVFGTGKRRCIIIAGNTR